MTIYIELRFVDATINLPGDREPSIAQARLAGVLARFPRALVTADRRGEHMSLGDDRRVLTYIVTHQAPCPRDLK